MKKYSYLLICLFFSACNGEKDIDEKDNGFLSYFIQTCPGCLECMNMERPADSYNYPVYPGTEEWILLTSHLEKMEVYQVPVDVLKKMSTHAVIQAILEHFGFRDMVILRSDRRFQLGFDNYFSTNNAFLEFT